MNSLPQFLPTRPKLLSLLPIGLLALQAVGCAHTRVDVDYDMYGEADPEGEAEIHRQFATLESTKEKVPKDEVKVLMNTLPDGISLDGFTIKVEEGYQHQLLGKFAFRANLAGMGAFWFIDYEESWGAPLCYPQTVLTWLTLGLWIVVPSSYPCWGFVELTDVDKVAKARRLGRAAGGNMVILTNFGGYVIKADPRGKPEEPTVVEPAGGDTARLRSPPKISTQGGKSIVASAFPRKIGATVP